FSITGTPGSPVGIAFGVQPTRTVQNLPISPTVTVAIQDQYGNTVTAASDTITVALGSNPAGGTLSGTKALATTNGAAAFTDIAIDRPGAGYTLAATSTLYGNATSNAFEIAAPPILISVGSLNTARTDLAAVLGPDNVIYALGGRGTDGVPLSSVERFDPATNSWSTAPSMPSARYGFGAVALTDGRILVIGGWDANGDVISSIDAYDTATGAWSGPIANLPVAVGGCAAAVGADGRVYVFGGRNASGSVTNLVQIYDPTTGSWSSGNKLPHSAASLTATAAPDGRIYVMGGDAQGGNMGPTIWAYNTALDDWDHAATQPKAQPGIAAATGSDGNVYAVGGYDNATEVFQSFKANANQKPYESVIGLSTFRSGLAAVQGPDGRIYAIGGSQNGVALTLVEAYGPSISITPSSGPAGTVVTVNGGNFGADATVQIYWNSIDPANLLATGTSDSSGRLTAPVEVTIPAAPGSKIIVLDTKSNYPASVPFTVQ
ncbi:MAG: Kelch repeat-containing protein, partial [Planctomycetota bacterium]